MKKKWITKIEIEKILKEYSIRTDEFEPVKKFENYYKSKFARGYIISIEPEEIKGKDIIKGEDIIDQTGRILIRHCKANGNVAYTDIWERTKENKLQFCCRQKKAELPDSAMYVQDLKEEIERLQKENKELQQQLCDANINKAEIADIKKLKDRLDEAIKQGDDYKEKYQKLKNDTDIRKSWNVGRKKRGESEKSKEMLTLVENILKNEPEKEEPWKTLGIGRASFFRYKKLIRSKK